MEGEAGRRAWGEGQEGGLALPPFLVVGAHGASGVTLCSLEKPFWSLCLSLADNSGSSPHWLLEQEGSPRFPRTQLHSRGAGWGLGASRA